MHGDVVKIHIACGCLSPVPDVKATIWFIALDCFGLETLNTTRFAKCTHNTHTHTHAHTQTDTHTRSLTHLLTHPLTHSHRGNLGRRVETVLKDSNMLKSRTVNYGKLFLPKAVALNRPRGRSKARTPRSVPDPAHHFYDVRDAPGDTPKKERKRKSPTPISPPKKEFPGSACLTPDVSGSCVLGSAEIGRAHV